MSSTIGNTKDLSVSRTEALHSLLNSLERSNGVSSSSTQLPTEQLQKLSEKINEILGDCGDHDTTLGDEPTSQLLDEDGLPIIDISEQVDEDHQTNTPHSSVPEQVLIPLSLLPLEERERRRRERDRILDLLEEEERLQRIQEERNAEEERKDSIRKRKESAKAGLDQLKAARELQKKMGQALVRRAERTEENRQEEDALLKPQITSSVAKKSVSFADAPAVEADERNQQTSIHQPYWGDVTPGRLRAQGRTPLVSTTEAKKYPMKMHVVERSRMATPTSPFHNDADSDDESTSSTGRLSPHMQNDSSDEKDRFSSSDSCKLSDDEPLEEGFDYSTAHHHREIALEYHKKRHAIGAETAKAMVANTFDEQETPNGQPLSSRFRADRIAAAYDNSHSPVSTSIGQTVIPTSRQKSLPNSMRLGKLENDQLVGGASGESGSEDESIRDVIQMLKTGRVQNAGPDFESSSITSPRHSFAVGSSSVEMSVVPPGAKPSRFKLGRGGRTTEPTAFKDDNSGDNPRSQPAISSVVERKAPSSSAREHFAVNKPPPRSSVSISELAPSTIVDSPSFPMTATGASTVATPPSSLAHHKSVGSPSPLARPLSVKSSATQDSMNQSPRDHLPMKKPISKFMAERR